MKVIPYGHQSISQADIDSVVAVLRSDFLTQGREVERFEKAFGEVVGAPHAVACANGTAALHLAALAAGLGPGDRVLVTPITFVASANCARFVGAEVVFSDIDPNDLTLSVSGAGEALARGKNEGRPFRAIVTVDLAGHPCAMQEFSRLKAEYNLIWIEDACHSLGATWTDDAGRSWKVGESSAPDFTTYSFHPVKHITTGEGGMITTHQPRLAERMRRLRTHGIVREPSSFVFHDEAFDRDGEANPWYYEAQSLGFNFRLTDFQCALGSEQLKRLPAFLERRRRIIDIYRNELSTIRGLRFPGVRAGIGHSWHLAVVRVDFTSLQKTRGRVMRALREKGVGSQVHYVPIPMMPFYAGSESMSRLPHAMAYYREALSLPVFPEMSDDDVSQVVGAVKTVLV
ncbi:UDP-4-amino-4,6-dideoxy-N-acetyl-beta-L-altrosamine transaminase [bacterium CG2_30_54_10]|nr:MAG: UDP-4-amino-4,6-dideoxy-N-acetyl-beta-L-altrosamine transaminase [bacterium CG2_30_54_10]